MSDPVNLSGTPTGARSTDSITRLELVKQALRKLPNIVKLENPNESMTTCGKFISWDISEMYVDYDYTRAADKIVLKVNAKLLNSSGDEYKRGVGLTIDCSSQSEYAIQAPDKLLSGIVNELKKWSQHKDRRKYVKPVHPQRDEGTY